MAVFKPYRVSSDRLNSLPIKDGQFIITSDTGKTYFDNGTTRVEINKYNNATKTSDGLMSADDKIKLENALTATPNASSTTVGGIKVRVDGDTLYVTNDGSDA
jgi:hypothetical protein